MSNTFDIKRFWNYLKYDLVSAGNDSGLTLAILGAMPVFFYGIIEAFSLIFSGHVTNIGFAGKVGAYVLAIGISLIFFPAKHYGTLTDKRHGSNWLMLPASRQEKWLSVLLVTCVAVPLFLLAELAATDGLLSLIFNGTYGATALKDICSGMDSVWSELSTEAGRIALSWPYGLYLSWCENILFFTLGSLCFKKSKVGKTFLAAFLLGMVVTMLTTLTLKIFGLPTELELSDVTEEGFIRGINIVIYAIYLVYFAVVDVLIYLRIKTLKH